jgi:hypothetical protein
MSKVFVQEDMVDVNNKADIIFIRWVMPSPYLIIRKDYYYPC